MDKECDKCHGTGEVESDIFLDSLETDGDRWYNIDEKPPVMFPCPDCCPTP